MQIAIIPAYEPPEKFYEYAAVLTQHFDRLLVVDDGSSAHYRDIFLRISGLANTVVLTHEKNMGKGYALKTAFAYCQKHYSPEDILVTADCDGQHALSDVLAVCQAARQHPDACVLGCRDFAQSNVPARSRAGNTQMLRLLKLMYGIRISDSQTGLRAFSVETAARFLEVSGDRFEYETGTLIYAKRHHIPFHEVTIQTIYPEQGQPHSSHFKTFRDSFRVIGILLWYLKGNILSGLLAAAADIGVFSLLTYVLLPRISPGFTMLATVVSRIASSLVNFFCNNLVFHGRSKQAIWRFYGVWVGQLLLSYTSLYLFGHILGGNLALVKLITDCCLGFLTYQLQCRWVYEPKKENHHIYGLFARFARAFLSLFSPKYRCILPETEEPVVYVCRHLNMHGPYTTLKWLPMELHPLVLHVFFDRKTTVDHMTAYTFSARRGKKPKRFSFAAWIMGWIDPALMRSLQAVPVYRGGLQSMTTVKTGVRYLLQGESLIVYPDIHYMDGYDLPSDIYDGFLYMGQLYHKKTGKPLSFVPLVIDDENRTVTARQSICVSDFRADAPAAAAYLKQAINHEPIPLPPQH